MTKRRGDSATIRVSVKIENQWYLKISAHPVHSQICSVQRYFSLLTSFRQCVIAQSTHKAQFRGCHWTESTIFSCLLAIRLMRTIFDKDMRSALISTKLLGSSFHFSWSYCRHGPEARNLKSILSFSRMSCTVFKSRNLYSVKNIKLSYISLSSSSQQAILQDIFKGKECLQWLLVKYKYQGRSAVMPLIGGPAITIWEYQGRVHYATGYRLWKPDNGIFHVRQILVTPLRRPWTLHIPQYRTWRGV